MKFNKYINLNRIEFIVTNACTSSCKHCGVVDLLKEPKNSIKKEIVEDIVLELTKLYDVKSVMTFGGEPLLYADATCAIHKAATQNNVQTRQIITNGYFSKDDNKIRATAKALKESGVNCLLLSIDTFHREYIPLEKVRLFAEAVLQENNNGFELHPAWVVNKEHNNKFNADTEECLNYFADLNIPVSKGNNIVPWGNAENFLSEFYEKKPIDLDIRCGEAPYTSKLDSLDTIQINQNGDVVVCCFVLGNVYRESITEILKRYSPYENPFMVALMNNGVSELLKTAGSYGISVDTSKYFSSCSICRDIVKRLSSVQ